MKIITADDEQLALEDLTSIVHEVKPESNIVSFSKSKELLAYAKKHSCDVAFLDIEMDEISGIEIAKYLKMRNPKINIIFVTGYNEYMKQAFQMHASGYVMKPVCKEDIRKEMEDLRTSVIDVRGERFVAKCFGTFDVFANGKKLVFEKSKTKEMLAYLIDRKGSSVTSGELRAILWGGASTDENTGSYLSKLKKDLIRTLSKEGVRDIFVGSWNQYAVDVDKISCDYYDYLKNRPEGIRAYNGEYMSQYSWGEIKNAVLGEKI